MADPVLELPKNASALSDWIVSQRPARLPVDALKPNGFFLEKERSATGEIVESACILLTNKECPWKCLMCDLWKHTLEDPTPLGAIPAQIHYALEQLGVRPRQIKLYNSGSFFDSGAIPMKDYESIAGEISFAERVIVECHPRLIGARAVRFRDLIAGKLEIAMGLETVHPEVIPKLNKRFTLADFERAAAFLTSNGMQLRAFILLQPPFVAKTEAVHWAVKSAEFAFDCGATAVSLIPTRAGNGAMDLLRNTGQFVLPTLRTLEEALESVLKLARGRVFADTWNLGEFSECAECFEPRQRRIQQMNLNQQVPHAVICENCGA